MATEEKVKADFDKSWGAGAWESTSEEQRARLMETAARNEQQEADLQFVAATLRAHGIHMAVSGCGCCGSPTVFFSHEGREFEYDGGDFDTRSEAK